jgi:tetratricopeptide (TPR) repeat protein
VLSGQTIASPEEEYSRIRALAFDGRYDEAEPAARLLVSEFPEYGDARILLGRIIAWQGRYDEAAAVIDTLLMTDPGNSDAAEALSDIRRWSRDRSQQVTLPPTSGQDTSSTHTVSPMIASGRSSALEPATVSHGVLPWLL